MDRTSSGGILPPELRTAVLFGGRGNNEAEEVANRMGIGVVCKLIGDKGIGFISPLGGRKDVFFHLSALTDLPFEELKVGQAVSFDLDLENKDRDRPRASKVTPCDPKLLGKKGAEEDDAKHPRARRRKPTWRR